MTDVEKREAARQFYQRWIGKGREDEDARSYWIEFLQNIIGMIITSNFDEIWVYDLEERKPEPQKFSLADIQTKYSLFEFLINKKQQKISQEMEVSVKAGEFVGLLYDAFLKQYINPENEESLKSLNMLCVRLVFCL